jgi:hypothetical protein
MKRLPEFIIFYFAQRAINAFHWAATDSNATKEFNPNAEQELLRSAFSEKPYNVQCCVKTWSSLVSQIVPEGKKASGVESGDREGHDNGHIHEESQCCNRVVSTP